MPDQKPAVEPERHVEDCQVKETEGKKEVKYHDTVEVIPVKSPDM